MRIKMMVGLSGPTYTLNPGEERVFPDEEALRIVQAGFAVPVIDRDIETAVRKPAAERRGKARRA
jgi:hypothetical protein